MEDELKCMDCSIKKLGIIIDYMKNGGKEVFLSTHIFLMFFLKKPMIREFRKKETRESLKKSKAAARCSGFAFESQRYQVRSERLYFHFSE